MRVFARGRASVFRARAIRVLLFVSVRISSGSAQAISYRARHQARLFAHSFVGSFAHTLEPAPAFF